MSAVAGPMDEGGAGSVRADFVLGDRDGTTSEPAFTALVAYAIRSRGYSVAINDPYKGVEIVRRHGRPALGQHSLHVELNRRLYMDEETLEPNANYQHLEDDLERLIGAVAAYVRTSIGKTT
jgi:N-formylglutamate amidohydrolase